MVQPTNRGIEERRTRIVGHLGQGVAFLPTPWDADANTIENRFLLFALLNLRHGASPSTVLPTNLSSLLPA